MTKEIAEFAFDMQAGMNGSESTQFDDLLRVSRATYLAVHLRGLGEIKFPILATVMQHELGVQKDTLRVVLEMMADAEFVTLRGKGRRIETITPDIPVFDDIYSRMGAFIEGECSFNEPEEATLDVLRRTKQNPFHRETLLRETGIERNLFAEIIELGTKVGLLATERARGRDIILNSVYFGENQTALADLAATAKTTSISTLLEKIKSAQGWPLKLVVSQGAIRETKLDDVELALIDKLGGHGLIKPPSIKFGPANHSFLFTPTPGKQRLNPANREIYERAMALVSAVRKGELLADRYKILYPKAIINKLRETKKLGANTEAANQYKNLTRLRLGRLVQIADNFFEFHLIDTEENVQAVDLAYSLVNSGKTENMEVNQQLRLSFMDDMQYVSSQNSTRLLRDGPRIISSKGVLEAAGEFISDLLAVKTR